MPAMSRESAEVRLKGAVSPPFCILPSKKLTTILSLQV
ncbi:hypothetical protein O53_2168 [Microcystis aeruginosa TAIHU98]|uniref:Uncharacterized protein n=1 Tax=Microcystis aeruginosa TAIHU98 TaxID=1134457 RepID=L7E2U4_MICAE|nr:hypothetical protein O53_2168 [Microcystis aeruginosa TAIHU98]